MSEVTVPADLLEKVLEVAEFCLWQVHGEFCLSTDKGPDGRHICDKEQELISQLRGLLPS